MENKNTIEICPYIERCDMYSRIVDTGLCEGKLGNFRNCGEYAISQYKIEGDVEIIDRKTNQDKNLSKMLGGKAGVLTALS